MQNSADTHAHPAQIETGSTSRTGIFTCILIIACISASYLALFGLEWERSQPLHTDLEGVATVMALIVGLMAIVNHYSQRQGLAFLLGVAFLGTATLDGYHAIVTSTYFKEYMPSDLPSLIPWSWIASRWFLSVFLFAMAIVWRLDLGTKITSPRGEITLYAIAVVFTLSSLTFFLFVPLPNAYYPDLLFHRPEEFVPALFFLLALIVFTWRRNWTSGPIEHWIVFSLVVNLCAQTIYMPNSSVLFDLEFTAAHFLKILSYALVFVGLLKYMFQNYRQVAAGEKSLAQQSLLLKTVLENVEEGISYYDKDLRLMHSNTNYLKLLGIPQHQFGIGDNMEDIFRYRAEHGEYGECNVEAVVKQKVDRARQFKAHQYEHTRPNGHVIQVTGRPIGRNAMVASYRDVTERVMQEQLLRNSELTLQSRVSELENLKIALENKSNSALQMAEDLRQARNVQQDAIQNISEGFVLWDNDDRLVMCNNVFRMIYWKLAEDIDKRPTFTEFLTLAYQRGVMELPVNTLLEDAIRARTKKHRQSVVAFDEQLGDGTWIRISERRTTGDSIVGIITDISDRKEWEGKMRHLAETDYLTGLPNRVIIQDRLQQAIDQADRLDTLVAVMVLDLDRFKDINDTMGHPAGDELLIQVAKRLVESGRKTDTIARLGGDEFAVIATNMSSPFDIEYLARRIVTAIAEPFQLSEHEVHTATSIGISFYPQDAKGPDELLRDADIALYQAKAEGGSIYRLYDAEIDSEMQTRQTMEKELRKAVKNNEFYLVYQPQLDIASGRMIGAEALLRWAHPERGIVSPGEFIETAEASRLIIPISEWVLREACLFSKRMEETGLADITVSVNISPLHFRQQGLYQSVRHAIKVAGIAPHKLELEITESMAMAHRGNIIDLLNNLKELGVGLAIDDFGTGYSSLSRLKDFPVDRLKIDRSFIIDMTIDNDHQAISAAIVRLGHALGLKVIAEGVETTAHLDILKELECDEAQGYLFAKPLLENDLIGFMQSRDIGSAAA
jgi:diguanylate cyclase (GGDEF)-like protein